MSSSPRLSVLVVGEWFPPSTKAGGPVRSLHGIVTQEASAHAICLLTRDRDLGDSEPFSSVRVGRWVRQDDYLVRRVPPDLEALPIFVTAARSADVVYLNSLFSPIFSLLPLIAMKVLRIHGPLVVIAPRGELAAAALEIRAWKKRPILRMLKRLLPRNDVVWQASNDGEARDIQHNVGCAGARVIVRSDPPPLLRDMAVVGGPLTALFLARMVPIKNFALLLDAVRHVEFPLNILVAGALEDKDYWEFCQPLIQQLPVHVTLSVLGHLDDAAVASAIDRSSVMILPTRSENFGHAIAESLAAGCPVMIPDTTGWTDVVRAGAGWIIDVDNPFPLLRALNDLAQEPESSIIARRRQVQIAYKTWLDGQALHNSLFVEAWRHKQAPGSRAAK